MKGIYRADGIDDRFFKMLRPVGSWDRKGCRHYALWRPVRRFLWFWVPCGEDFWLDTCGFEETK